MQSPKSTLLFLSDIFSITFYSFSEIQTRILIACVIRQTGFCRGNVWLHCRIEIHSPHLVWAHCSHIHQDGQVTAVFQLSSFSLNCAAKTLDLEVKSFLPVSDLEESRLFSCRRLEKPSLHLWWLMYEHTLWNFSVIRPAERIQTPHCCWLYDLKLQLEFGWVAVGSPVLFQSDPWLTSSSASSHILKISN